MNIGLEMYKLFDEYYSLSSNEWRKTIVGYEPVDESIELPKDVDRNVAIKVLFKNKSWIRVYRIRNEVEWY
jgi:hypothetical protein